MPWRHLSAVLNGCVQVLQLIVSEFVQNLVQQRNGRMWSLARGFECCNDLLQFLDLPVKGPWSTHAYA